MKKGLYRGVPSPLAKWTTSSWKVISPPIPLANTTPTRSVIYIFFADAGIRNRLVADPKGGLGKAVQFPGFFFFQETERIKIFQSQAKRVLNFVASNRVMKSAPETP